MPRLTPHYQFIAIAPTIARGFTEQATGNPRRGSESDLARDRSAGRRKRRARPDQ